MSAEKWNLTFAKLLFYLLNHRTASIHEIKNFKTIVPFQSGTYIFKTKNPDIAVGIWYLFRTSYYRFKSITPDVSDKSAPVVGEVTYP